MKRLPVIAAAVLAIAASIPFVCATTSAASAQEWRDRDGDTDRDLRDILRDRIQTREDLRDFIIDLIHDRQDMRDRFRERMARWRDRDEDEDYGGLRGRVRERMAHWRDRDEDEGHGGLRGRVRERIGERIAERRRGREEGECYFLTRSLRDEDRDFLVIVRRRVCPD